jgi:hypothetical protein
MVGRLSNESFYAVGDCRITLGYLDLATTRRVSLRPWGFGRATWHCHDSPHIRHRWLARPRPQDCGPRAHYGSLVDRMILTIIAVVLIVWRWGPKPLRRDSEFAVAQGIFSSFAPPVSPGEAWHKGGSGRRRPPTPYGQDDAASRLLIDCAAPCVVYWCSA